MAPQGFITSRARRRRAIHTGYGRITFRLRNAWQFDRAPSAGRRFDRHFQRSGNSSTTSFVVAALPAPSRRRGHLAACVMAAEATSSRVASGSPARPAACAMIAPDARAAANRYSSCIQSGWGEHLGKRTVSRRVQRSSMVPRDRPHANRRLRGNPGNNTCHHRKDGCFPWTGRRSSISRRCIAIQFYRTARKRHDGGPSPQPRDFLPWQAYSYVPTLGFAFFPTLIRWNRQAARRQARAGPSSQKWLARSHGACRKGQHSRFMTASPQRKTR